MLHMELSWYEHCILYPTVVTAKQTDPIRTLHKDENSMTVKADEEKKEKEAS